MIYIESDRTDPYYNLALEEYVFEQMDRSEAYFMLWQNENSIIVGKYQNTAEEINRAVVEERGIRVARRLSGGGAVYHDLGNLNFTFIMDAKDTEDYNFSMFVVPVIRALAGFGITAEFNGRNDITINEKKFSGNSQYGKHGRVMHHGCIMLDSNLANVADALKVKEAKFESKSVKSVQSRVTTINANAKTPISMQEFKDALKASVFETGQISEYTLTGEDREQITRLRDEKYATWEWNFGASPDYAMEREKRFAAGLVSVRMSVERGTIAGIRIYGDFFGDGDIAELEQGLTGLRLDETLEQELERLNPGHYMRGIPAKEFADLLK